MSQNHGRGRGRYSRSSYNNQNRMPQNNYSQPAYSTQPGYATPPAKSITEPTSTPVQQQVISTQSAQQQPLQPVLQQIPPQPVPPPKAASAQQQPSQTTVPNMGQDKNVQNNQSASVKNETESLANTTASSEETMDTEGSGEVRRKYKPWMKRGSLGIKISRKIKKRRQNARLRNILAPKNAMMVLHELHPELKMTISEQPNAANQMGYTVEIEIDGKIYRGHGMSKVCAKQAGSENALKAVLLEKLEKNNVKLNSEQLKTGNWEEEADMVVSNDAPEQATTPQAPPPPTPPSNAGVAADGNKDGQEGQDGQGANKPFAPGVRQIQEDDVPWGSLASFALYKLFSEWQSQGFQLPASSGLPAVFQRAGVPLPIPKKILPDDASKKHPVQLLNQIRPGCQYIESREGMPPNHTFTFSVVVDGQTYSGVGANKKDAKKECAKHALEAMGVKYD